MRTLAFWGASLVLGLLACSSEDSPPAPGQAGSAGTSAGPSGTSGSGGTSASAGSSSGGTSQGGSTAGGAPSSAGTNSAGTDASGSAGSSSAGSGCGTATPMPAPDVTECPAPAGTEGADAALLAVNTLRAHMGLPCMTVVPAINTSAQKHCDYYQQNRDDDACVGNAHAEVESCAGFVAASFATRMTAAGYTGSPRSEVMAFSGDPPRAVAQWINSVYHRSPLLSPWIREMGYGMTEDCDTIDMGQGPKTPDDVTAVYPYPGQVEVPLDFDGSREGPMPPQPASGWPSGSPIHLYAKNYTVTSHELYLDTDPSCQPVPHQWLPDKDQYILYADMQLYKFAKYRVFIRGTRGGAPLDFDWTFTTEN